MMEAPSISGAVFADLFGSDSESEQHVADSIQHIHEVPGLCIYKEWIPEEEQEFLLDCIDSDGWLANGSNQAMHFGELPRWLGNTLRKNQFPTSLLPPEVTSREPLFNQMIINRYQPGEGIKPHVDLARFEDGIAIISLGGSAFMSFTQPKEDPEKRVQVLLEAGDLLILGGSSRWEWCHEIKSVVEETYNGIRILRGVRTSITLRRMKQGIVLTEAA